MTIQPYSQLIGYKRWADRGLYAVLGRDFGRLPKEDAAIMLRILDHMHVVDRIFMHHLQGLPHSYQAARSAQAPEYAALAGGAREAGDWYAAYVAQSSAGELEQAVDFAYANGTPARMRRGEIILHVCLHGAYHRGNAGVILQKNGIAPNDDRLTDFLESAA